jgi:trk system potassium uptake protein
VHVVVVGCGRVGSALSHALLELGHTVSIIDRRREAFDRLGEDFAGHTIEGIGFDRDRLIEAGIEEATAVAAVTSGDNSNVLVARVARENFGIDRVVARIYDPRRATIYQRLGLPTVATVAWTTDRVLRRLLPSSTPAEWTDPTAKLCLVERVLPDAWAGQRLSELEEAVGARVSGVGRLGSALVPGRDTVGQQGDLLYIAVRTDDVESLDKALAGQPGAGG